MATMGRGKLDLGVVALVAGLAGCGGATPPLPATCALSAGAFEQALAAAPGPVRLTDGTPISVCVDRARSGADLVNVGTVLTAAADDLATRATRPAVALELGYLVGATRRGATHTNGVAAELRHRIDAAAALRGAGAAALAALHQGIAAGQSSG